MGLRPRDHVSRPVSVSITYPSSNGRTDRRATLRITDETSSIELIEIELTADQYLTMLSTGSAYADGVMPANLDRIGKAMINRELHLGWSNPTTGESWNKKSLDQRLTEWLIEVDMETGSHAGVGGGGGYRLTGRRWVDPVDLPRWCKDCAAAPKGLCDAHGPVEYR